MTDQQNGLTLKNAWAQQSQADGYASSVPPTLSMQFGQAVSPYLQAVKNLFPASNPYGQAVSHFLLGQAPEAAQRMAEGEPYVLADTRAGRQLIKPAALDMAGALPLGVVAKGAGAASKAAGSVKGIASAVLATEKKVPNMVRLYHGGHGEFSEVPKGGSFDGFFGSADLQSAKSHGSGFNYYADIPEHKILTHYDLNYEIPYEKTKKAFQKITGITENDDNFDDAWKAIIEESGNEYAESANLSDAKLDDPALIAQKLRGRIAKELGFHAVEMSDEHGTSYLMVPGVKLNKVEREK
jgi:hypothetical protein